MTIRYCPDTCDCIIRFSHDGTTFEEWEQKCQMHKSFNGQILFDKILEHNRSIGVLSTDTPTVTEIANIMKEKLAEKNRIKSLGEPVKNESASKTLFDAFRS